MTNFTFHTRTQNTTDDILKIYYKLIRTMSILSTRGPFLFVKKWANNILYLSNHSSGVLYNGKELSTCQPKVKENWARDATDVERLNLRALEMLSELYPMKSTMTLKAAHWLKTRFFSLGKVCPITTETNPWL